MKITPNVVAQNKNISYKLTLKNTSNIESIEVLSRGDYYHKDTLKYKIKNNTILFSPEFNPLVQQNLNSYFKF